MNKRLSITAALVAAFIGAGAGTSADENTACGAVMCLFGQATGHGGGGACNKYLNPYYAIKVFDWSGFNPSKTADKRKQFLQQCRSSDTSTIEVANSNGGSENPPTTSDGGGKPGNPGCNGLARCVTR
jgi:hypothetical protein